MKLDEKKRPKLTEPNSPGFHSNTAKSSTLKLKQSPTSQGQVQQTETTLKEVKETTQEIERAIRDNVEKMLDQKIEDKLEIISEKIMKDRQGRLS